MGFHKRILRKENIIAQKNRIIEYLSVDAVQITDSFSRDVHDLYIQGKTQEEIIKYITENENED